MRPARDNPRPSPSSPALCFRFVALALLAFSALGCGARASTARRPRAPSPPAAASASSRTLPSPSPSPSPTAGDAPQPDPEASRLFLLRATQPGAPRPTGLGPPRVTALALTNTARGEATGMRPDGEPQVLKLGEGERGTVEIRVDPGECAAFIAQGGLGVIEIDLFVTTGAPPSLEILAQDADTGPIAVIGGRGGCFVATGGAPLAAELHAQARRGGGVVLVQGYRGPLPGSRSVPGSR